MHSMSEFKILKYLTDSLIKLLKPVYKEICHPYSTDQLKLFRNWNQIAYYDNYHLKGLISH